jgi:transposase-like protein
VDDIRTRLEKLLESGEGTVGIRKAAEILGVAEGTLYQWRSKGINIRSYKSGGKIIYDVADLLAYLEGHASEPAA